jgi:hypothetical protein
MHRLQSLSALVLAAALPLHAQADTLLLDFGSTLYTGTDSPGHEDGLATGGTWNSISGDTASGLVDENGNALTGVGIDFGTGTLSSINYGNAVKPLAVDHSAYPQWDTDLGRDHVVRDSGDPALAIAVTGLAEGVYDFYFTGFRGDSTSNAARDYDVRTAISSSAVTDFSSATAQVLTNSSPTTTTSWIAGDNYITGQVTIGAGEDFYLYVNSPDENEFFQSFIGVASSLELVVVPEPTSLTLLAAGSILLARRRRS